MPRLANSKLSDITEALNKTFFTSAGYTIETDDDDLTYVTIEFKDNPDFRIVFYRCLQKDLFNFSLDRGDAKYNHLVTCTPGDFTATETTKVKGFNGFQELLSQWVARVEQESLLVRAFEKSFDQFGKHFEAKLDEHIKDSAVHFTEEEKTDLITRLRQLEEEVSKLSTANASAAHDVQQVKETLNELIAAAKVLSKRAWFRTAASKIYLLTGKVLSYEPIQKVLTAAGERLLLPPGSG